MKKAAALSRITEILNKLTQNIEDTNLLVKEMDNLTSDNKLTKLDVESNKKLNESFLKYAMASKLLIKKQ